ncbi:MAG: dienelactone hydrolase family protein [Chitinophagaceae bacterium]
MIKIFRQAAINLVLVCSIVACQKAAPEAPPVQADPEKPAPVPVPPPAPAPPPPVPTPPADIPETNPAIQTAVSINVNGNCGGYYKAVPARYDSSTKRYPLIIFLHGLGELGNGTTELVKVSRTPLAARIASKNFPVKFTVNGQNYSFIVISPQFKKWPSPADVDAIINHAKQTLRIDASRIYVMGMSMGGGATWEYGAGFGAGIAAIAPICGASTATLTRAKKIAAANLPVWAFHNIDDLTVNVGSTNKYVEDINAQNPAVRAIKTIWSSGGHDAWTKATDPAFKENGKNVYEWMLQYKR